MALTSDLALGVFIEGAFGEAGLNPAEFNYRTPLSFDLLLLLGEDLIEVEQLFDAAEQRLSVRELLTGEREHHAVTPQHRYSWTLTFEAGTQSLEHRVRAEVYNTICARRGEEPQRVDVTFLRDQRRRRAAVKKAKRLIAAKWRK